VGEAHHDDRTEFDRENQEIQKAMDQIPCSPKLDQNRPESGPPNLLHGPIGPIHLHLTSRFVHSQVCGPYDLFSHISLSVLNQIENPIINNFKIGGKNISVMTKG
jgi:hypothetical protein